MYIRGAYAMSGSNSTAPFDVNQITHFLLGLQNPLLEALKPDDYATYAELLLCGVTLEQVRCANGDPSSLVNFAHALHTWVEHYANESSYLELRLGIHDFVANDSEGYLRKWVLGTTSSGTYYDSACKAYRNQQVSLKLTRELLLPLRFTPASFDFDFNLLVETVASPMQEGNRCRIGFCRQGATTLAIWLTSDGYTASLPTDRNETPEFIVPYRDTLVATQIDVINFFITEGYYERFSSTFY